MATMSLAQTLPILKTAPNAQASLASDETVMNAITVGTIPLGQNSESGAIMRVLMQEPGFARRITDGMKNGHAYNIVHVPGSPNFVLRDMWTNAAGKRETRYQSFVITSAAASHPSPGSSASSNLSQGPQSTPGTGGMPEDSASDTSYGSPTSPDMLSQLFDSVEHSLDEFLSFARA